MLRKIISKIRTKDTLLCLASALLLSVSFSSFNLWPAAWFGFVPLFCALNNKSPGRAFVIAYLTGASFWFFSIYWLAHVTFVGLVVLVLYLALYFGIFGLLFSFACPLPAACCLLFISASWVLLEYLRSWLFSGFPWALLAHSQYINLAVIQIADITGAWGVSFLVIMVNLSIYWLVACRLAPAEKIKRLVLPVSVMMIILIYGHYKLCQAPNIKQHAPTKVGVIQGNIPQELKWNSAATEIIWDRYKEQTLSASLRGAELIIWPEAAVPEVLGEDNRFFQRLSSLAAVTGKDLLAGAVELKGGDYFNSALLFNGKGELAASYHKLHLVPFGEYVPFKKAFPFLETVVPIGDISRGREHTVFYAPGGFSVLICFEDLFPQLSRDFVRRGAGFLVNITNDAWYKKSSAAYQHFAASVFRAVENRVYLVRSANTGISGFISPQGRLTAAVERQGKKIFVPGFSVQDIFAAENTPTLYNLYGDFFILVCLLFAAYGIMLILKNRR